MADKATYLLMATYIILFAGVFVGVFVAIWYMGREQATPERPVVREADETAAPALPAPRTVRVPRGPVVPAS